MRQLALLSCTAALVLAAQPSHALLPAVNNWIEIGDAGGPDDPQIMFGDGSVRQIGGDIGGDDVVDVFTFHFEQGDGVSPFAAHVEIEGTPPEPVQLFLHLLTEDGRRLIFGEDSIRFDHLDSGLYHIGVSTEAFDTPDALLPDPPYVITFDIGDIRFVPVPEPAGLTLLGLGLAALAFRRRRG